MTGSSAKTFACIEDESVQPPSATLAQQNRLDLRARVLAVSIASITAFALCSPSASAMIAALVTSVSLIGIDEPGPVAVVMDCMGHSKHDKFDSTMDETLSDATVNLHVISCGVSDSAASACAINVLEISATPPSIDQCKSVVPAGASNVPCAPKNPVGMSVNSQMLERACECGQCQNR